MPLKTSRSKRHPSAPINSASRRKRPPLMQSRISSGAITPSKLPNTSHRTLSTPSFIKVTKPIERFPCKPFTTDQGICVSPFPPLSSGRGKLLNTTASYQWLESGSTADVFVGTMLTNQLRPVAIKRFKRSTIDNPLFLRDLVHTEDTLSQRVNPHPNMVKYFGKKEIDHHWCFVFEYISYGDIQSNWQSLAWYRIEDALKIIKATQHTPLDVIRYFILEIGKGLEHLERKGIVHTDFKIENILLGTDGHLKFCDMGYGDYNFSSQHPTRVTHYSPPELHQLSPQLDRFHMPKRFQPHHSILLQRAVSQSPFSPIPQTKSRWPRCSIKQDIYGLGVFLNSWIFTCIPPGLALAANAFTLEPPINSTTEDDIKAILQLQKLISGLLSPNPNTRWNIKQIIGSDFMRSGNPIRSLTAIDLFKHLFKKPNV